MQVGFSVNSSDDRVAVVRHRRHSELPAAVDCCARQAEDPIAAAAAFTVVGIAALGKALVDDARTVGSPHRAARPHGLADSAQLRSVEAGNAQTAIGIL